MAREGVHPRKGKGGKLCVEPKEVGEILNEYFASVFTKERDTSIDGVSEGCVNPLDQAIITREEVSGVLKRIKVYKSPGLDGIYPRLRREPRD